MSVAVGSSEPHGASRVASSVFIHSAWRSAGTWIWNEFRADPRTMAFYEPLHEDLGALSLERIDHTNPDSWDSGHPRTDPYFREYAPLLPAKRAGVAGFDRSFAFDRFFMDDEEIAPRLRHYLLGLRNAAHGRGKLPVFKFCRSLGRAGWMRRQFPDVAHVAVIRDPISQWESCWKQARTGTPYFLASPLALLASNMDEPLVAAAVDALHLRIAGLRRATYAKTYAQSERFVELATADTIYRSSLAYWLIGTLAALPHADLVIDADQLARSAEYRAMLERDITERTGLTVDFGSARATHSEHESALRAVDVDAAHAAALVFCGSMVTATSDPRIAAAARTACEKLLSPLVSR